MMFEILQLTENVISLPFTYRHFNLFMLHKIKQMEIMYDLKLTIKRYAKTFTLTWFEVTAHSSIYVKYEQNTCGDYPYIL